MTLSRTYCIVMVSICQQLEEASSSLQLTLDRGTETLRSVLSHMSPTNLKHLQVTVNGVDFLVKLAQLAALAVAPLDPTERKPHAARVRGLNRIVELRRAAEPTMETGEVCELLGVTRETIRQKVTGVNCSPCPKAGTGFSRPSSLRRAPCSMVSQRY